MINLHKIMGPYWDQTHNPWTVFNLEHAIAPLAPLKGKWSKFGVYWGRNGALQTYEVLKYTTIFS